MRRVVALLALALIAIPASASSQSPEPSALPRVPIDACLSVLAPEGFVVTPAQLVQGLADGTVTIVAAASCPTEATGTPAPEPSIAASATHLPLVVTESAFRIVDGDGYAVALISNPNSDWVTNRMSVVIDFLDAAGELVTTDSDTISLLPGQVAAITTDTSDAKGAESLRITPSDTESDWEQIDYTTGDLTFSQVKTKKDDLGDPVTTGRVASTFDDDWQYVTVTAVYRDKAGKIVGYGDGTVDTVPGGGQTSFKTDSYVSVPRIAKTEMYYQP